MPKDLENIICSILCHIFEVSSNEKVVFNLKKNCDEEGNLCAHRLKVKMDIINIIVLLVQIIVLVIECIFAIRGYHSIRNNERGIFILQYKHVQTNLSFQDGYYNFDNPDAFFEFELFAAPVIILNTSININGTLRTQLPVDSNEVFVCQEPHNKVVVPLLLSKNDLSNSVIDFVIVLKLQTLSGLEYKEKVVIKCIKDQASYWR